MLELPISISFIFRRHFAADSKSSCIGTTKWGQSILLRKHCIRSHNGIKYCLNYPCVLMRALWTVPCAEVTPKREGGTGTCVSSSHWVSADMVVSLPGFPEKLLPSPVWGAPSRGVMCVGLFSCCLTATKWLCFGCVLPLVSPNSRCLVRLELQPRSWKLHREVFF